MSFLKLRPLADTGTQAANGTGVNWRRHRNDEMIIEWETARSNVQGLAVNVDWDVMPSFAQYVWMVGSEWDTKLYGRI